MSVQSKRNSEIFLDQVYDTLDYTSGDLVEVNIPRTKLGEENYLSKGQWVETCASINRKTNEFKIDRIFFVQDNPVVVFIDANGRQKGEIFKIFNSVWSLARPRLVFIENDTSVTVYDLASMPAKSDEELDPLAEIIKESKQILRALKAFDRESIESGLTFGDKRFDIVNNRADQTLINDLKQARKKLFEQGLNGDKLKYAHALIGRSIFIRYLEDRGVLTKDYFTELAKDNSEELSIVETPLQVNFYREEMKELIYPRILTNKNLTFKLFRKLTEDFNGDTFTTDSEEENIIQQSHLILLQNFLLGAGNSDQLSLFLWAYRFDIIPIDLISSIYEEFYHSENLIDKNTQKLKDSKGTHYTPSSLVEFVLARTLTTDVLKDKPRVMDPACGSGIFLVESFRRMVRYELYQKSKAALDLEELLKILKEQIAGIEINHEAIKIAAFSLYLSLLNYLNPPNILNYIKKGGKLPYLINHGKSEANHFNILLESSTFNETKTNVFFKSFNIIVGNPPWGSPSTKDIVGRKELEVITRWCADNNKVFPNKEISHAFLWRSFDFLKSGGISALLVSSGVLFKFSNLSNRFKKQILAQTYFREVINFSQIRKVFFSEAISPFIFLKLENSKPKPNQVITYISLTRTESIEKNKIVLIDKNDIKRIRRSYTDTHDSWKIFYWGHESDYNLISSIRRFKALKEFCNLSKTAQGFKEANKAHPALWLENYKEIPVIFFSNKYDSFNLDSSDDSEKLAPVPQLVEARGKEDLYNGKRILIRKGILQKGIEPKGQIVSRLETDSFSFRHSIICIKLTKLYSEKYKIVLGVLWSSLFRYYMFMTSSRWGLWHEELNKIEVLNFPLALTGLNLELENAIARKVDQLIELNSELKSFIKYSNSLLNDHQVFQQILINPEIIKLNTELDDLIFDLYELTDFERSLIEERCQLTIDYYYKGKRSTGSQNIVSLDYLSNYIKTFKNYWQRKLDEGETFSHTYITSKDGTMVGIAFKLGKIGEVINSRVSQVDISEFHELIKSEISRNVFTEGLFRRVTKNDQIIIIKRNRKNIWTKTEAKIDADAAFLQIFKTPTESTAT